MSRSRSEARSDDAACNLVVLGGRLTAAPVERTTADGRSTWSFDLLTDTAAAGRCRVPIVVDVERHRGSGHPVPDLGSLRLDAFLLVVGSVRRRVFRAGGATVTRTEVVADRVEMTDGRRPGVRARRRLWSSLSASEVATLRSGLDALPGVPT